MTKRQLLVKEFKLSDNSELFRCFPSHGKSYIQVGEDKFIFPERFREWLNEIHNMTFRPNDVFVVTYPRSGTTWSQELVWLIVNDYDFLTAKSTPLLYRYKFIEVPLLLRSELKVLQKIEDEQKLKYVTKQLSVTCRRFIKTHTPISILPPELLDTAKVVYVARDPRDVCVSMYFLALNMEKLVGYNGDFKTYWSLFKNNLILWTPFFAHVKRAWDKRNHPNMLFLFYEEMIQDMPSVIQRVSKFFGKTCNEEQIQALCEHLKFGNFSKNKAVQRTAMEDSGIFKEGEKFIRKGVVGGWRKYFDEEMTQEAERWIAENLRDTDLRFPEDTASEPQASA